MAGLLTWIQTIENKNNLRKKVPIFGNNQIFVKDFKHKKWKRTVLVHFVELKRKNSNLEVTA